ncbi:MAG: radical SAM family heme chaperone HemW [Hydrogenoanaerobacterium sp.]
MTDINFAPMGLYIHVPFCVCKCPYCDFYSLAAQNDNKMDEYTAAVMAALFRASGKFKRSADTVYFGGGTPVLLGERRISKIIQGAHACFDICEDAEITIEMNPTGDKAVQEKLLQGFFAAGVNRLSVGLQSANADELLLLGRQHTAEQAAQTVKAAQSAGFDNISLDLMLGLPQQTVQSVKNSVDFCAELGVKHISAYILKIEEGTAFEKNNTAALCPSDDEQAELYLCAVKRLAEHGFLQYEISNFAKSGFESRHNLKYWTGEEYLGIGPSAHSMMNGERFYYKRSLNGFIADSAAVLREDDDKALLLEQLCGGAGAGAEEYIMLRLRLAQGLLLQELHRLYPQVQLLELIKKAEPMERAGLCNITKKAVCLTAKGFLVSNSVIARLSS